jgi:PAS domain S-box-containing protein
MALLPEAAQIFAVRRAGILPIASIPTDSPVGAAMAALGVDHLAWLSATEHGRPAGAVVLYWRHSPIRIDPIDLEGLSVVADLLTAVLRRRDADIALRDSEARFRVMADSSPLLIWVYDLRGKLVFANRACELFTRRSGPELLATDPSMPVHPAERVALAEAFRRAAETGTSFEIECRAQRGDGQWRSLLVSAAPLVGADGGARGLRRLEPRPDRPASASRRSCARR